MTPTRKTLDKLGLTGRKPMLAKVLSGAARPLPAIGQTVIARTAPGTKRGA